MSITKWSTTGSLYLPEAVNEVNASANREVIASLVMQAECQSICLVYTNRADQFQAEELVRQKLAEWDPTSAYEHRVDSGPIG